jgi:hypothetical protein
MKVLIKDLTKSQVKSAQIHPGQMAPGLDMKLIWLSVVKR